MLVYISSLQTFTACNWLQHACGLGGSRAGMVNIKPTDVAWQSHMQHPPNLNETIMDILTVKGNAAPVQVV